MIKTLANDKFNGNVDMAFGYILSEIENDDKELYKAIKLAMQVANESLKNEKV